MPFLYGRLFSIGLYQSDSLRMECKTLTIDPEFSALGPKLTIEEENFLFASLERDGCRDAIVVWANNEDIILDGHNRYPERNDQPP